MSSLSSQHVSDDFSFSGLKEVLAQEETKRFQAQVQLAEIAAKLKEQEIAAKLKLDLAQEETKRLSFMTFQELARNGEYTAAASAFANAHAVGIAYACIRRLLSRVGASPP